MPPVQDANEVTCEVFSLAGCIAAAAGCRQIITSTFWKVASSIPPSFCQMQRLVLTLAMVYVRGAGAIQVHDLHRQSHLADLAFRGRYQRQGWEILGCQTQPYLSRPMMLARKTIGKMTWSP